jgi:putative ABC transport system permease protein
MEILIQDLRYAARSLASKPGFTVLAVIALALGIGANTAIFSVVNATLLRSLPYPEPERLVMIWGTTPQVERASISPPDFLDFKEQNQVFERIAAFNSGGFTLTGENEPEQIRGARVSADFFAALGVNPILGRSFLPEDEKPGASRIVILSQALWQRRFNSDQSIIGKSVTLNGQSYEVAAVMPASFQFTVPGIFRIPAELWVPYSLIKDESARNNHYLRVIARLKPGAARESAQAEMDAIAAQLERQYPNSNSGTGVRVVALREQIVGNIRPALMVLFGAVGFVLLIACANVANLLLARAAARHKEIAVRTALGATRSRLIRQLLTESVLLSLIGGTIGILLALWGADALASLGPESLPRIREIRADGYALGFTIALSLLTGILFGLAPALATTKPDLNEALKEGSRGSSAGFGRNRLHKTLVAFEVAAALVLLAGAGLLIKSFARLRDVNAGFDAKNVLTATISLPRSRYPDAGSQLRFFQQAIERIEALPGVKAVGAINDLPLSGDKDSTTFTIEGQPLLPMGQQPNTEWRLVNKDYFKAMSIPIIKGRVFTQSDTSEAPAAIIINEEMAARYFPGEDPVGKRLVLNLTISNPSPIPREIVGVAGNARDLALDSETRPEVYAPFLQETVSYMALMVKTESDPASLAVAVRAEARAIDKDLPVSSIQTMEQVFAGSIAGRRFNMLLLGVFAAAALILAAVGIYGVMSYSVTERTRELGIRMALGASSGDILKLVVGQGMRLAAIGLGAGLVAALVLTRALSSLLYEVSATDPLTFAAISFALASVALMACYIPARRAAKVDPMVALRYE